MSTARYGTSQGFAGTTEARKHPHTPVRDNKSTGNILYIYNTRASENQLDQPPRAGREDLREDPHQGSSAATDACNTAYYMALGYYPPPRIQAQMEAITDAGAAPSLIVAVLDYTAEHAPRPSWAYAQAVLRRKLAEGILSGEAFTASVAAWYGLQDAQRTAAPQGRRQPKQVLEQLYEQRTYDPAQYDSLSPEEITEAMRYATPAEEVQHHA